MDKSKTIKLYLQEFGMVIRRHRSGLKLSQEKFADMIGIHRTHMSNIELGKEEIGLGLAYKIASVLGISLRELTGLAEDNIK